MLIFAVGDGALDGNPKTHFAHFEDPLRRPDKNRINRTKYDKIISWSIALSYISVKTEF